MSLTKTGVLLTLLVFYAFITIGLNFYGASIQDNPNIETNTPINLLTDNETIGDAASNLIKKTPVVREKFNIIVAIGNIPFWINAIIFAPLFVIIAWILVTSFIPTINGGS